MNKSLNTKYLKKFRKRYSYIFEGNNILLIDHKKQQTKPYSCIQNIILYYVNEHLGFGSASLYIDKKYRRMQRLNYSEALNKLKQI